MMIFTYYDGIKPNKMKFVWFKNAHPDYFNSSILKDDPTGDFLFDHISHKLLKSRIKMLKGIHSTNTPIDHEYTVQKVSIINDKKIVQRGEIEWRKATYISLNNRDKVFAFVRDITKYKMATTAVEQKNQLKIALFENLKDMVFVSTPDGRFMDFNPAASEMLGYSANELLIINMENLYVDIKHRLKMLKKINQYGFVKDHETIFRHKDGTEIPVLITATPFELQGKGTVFQGVIRDISEIKKQEQLQGVLAIAGSVLHGFSQPLHSLRSTADCIADDLKYMVNGVGEVLSLMIETRLDRTDIERYSKKLYDILLAPADSLDPSLKRTLDDINFVKKLYDDMNNLINEIREIKGYSDLKKVKYSESSQIIDIKGMGGFETPPDE